jgi:hypothetical protein
MNDLIFKSRSIGTHLVPNTDTVIYTCPNNYTAHITLLMVANLGSGNKTISAKWYNNSVDDTFTIIGGYIVSGYNYLKLDGSYLAMNAGDYLMLNSETGSTMDSTVTVEEYYDPTSRQ